jgi:hypothetical protein
MRSELMAMATLRAFARSSAPCLADVAAVAYGDITTVKHNPQVRPTGLGGSPG